MSLSLTHAIITLLLAPVYHPTATQCANSETRAGGVKTRVKSKYLRRAIISRRDVIH